MKSKNKTHNNLNPIGENPSAIDDTQFVFGISTTTPPRVILSAVEGSPGKEPQI